MHFLEIALQHVRGFSPSGRHALKPGYTVLKPPSPEVPAALAQVAAAVLYADGKGGEAVHAQPNQKAKVMLTLVGQDGRPYRVLRELGGAGVLHRLGGPAPEVVSQDPAQVVQFLRGTVGLPPRPVFETLYCLHGSQLPSRRRPAKKDAEGAAALGPQVAPAKDVPAAQAHAATLEKELALAQQVDAVTFEHDGAQRQLFDAERVVRLAEEGLVAVKEAEAEAARAPTIERLGLPADIEERIARFPLARQRRDEALAKLRQEAGEERSTAHVPYVEPLVRERGFWLGIGAGVLCLVAGVLLSGGAKYVALLGVPAFGYAAMLALRYVEALQQREQVSRRGDRVAAREKKIQEDYQADTAAVTQALDALQVDAPADVLKELERGRELVARVAQQRQDAEARLASPEVVEARATVERLRTQLDALTRKLQDLGEGYTRDAREVERELARVRESIALARAGAGAGPGGASDDPSTAVLAAVADVMVADVPAAAVLLRERCVQYVAALTDRRYTGVEWDRTGRVTLLAADGRRLGAPEVPPKDLDLYYLALRMTAVERLTAKLKAPLLVEDAFAGVDEAKLPLVARMLKHLGTLNQVVHVTPHPGFAQLSDLQVNL